MPQPAKTRDAPSDNPSREPTVGRHDPSRKFGHAPLQIGLEPRHGRRAGVGLADVRGLEPRGLRGGGKLATELTEHHVLAAAFYQTEGCGIPKCSRAAVADEHFVALGRAKQLAEARANAADEVLDGCLTV